MEASHFQEIWKTPCLLRRPEYPDSKTCFLGFKGQREKKKAMGFYNAKTPLMPHRRSPPRQCQKYHYLTSRWTQKYLWNCSVWLVNLSWSSLQMFIPDYHSSKHAFFGGIHNCIKACFTGKMDETCWVNIPYYSETFWETTFNLPFTLSKTNGAQQGKENPHVCSFFPNLWSSAFMQSLPPWKTF